MALPNRNPLRPPSPEEASPEDLEARRLTLEAVQAAVAGIGPAGARDARSALDQLGTPTLVEVELPQHLVEAVGHLAQRAGVTAEEWLTSTLVFALADEIDITGDLLGDGT